MRQCRNVAAAVPLLTAGLPPWLTTAGAGVAGAVTPPDRGPTYSELSRFSPGGVLIVTLARRRTIVRVSP